MHVKASVLNRCAAEATWWDFLPGRQVWATFPKGHSLLPRGPLRRLMHNGSPASPSALKGTLRQVIQNCTQGERGQQALNAAETGIMQTVLRPRLTGAHCLALVTAPQHPLWGRKSTRPLPRGQEVDTGLSPPGHPSQHHSVCPGSLGPPAP